MSPALIKAVLLTVFAGIPLLAYIGVNGYEAIIDRRHPCKHRGPVSDLPMHPNGDCYGLLS